MEIPAGTPMLSMNSPAALYGKHKAMRELEPSDQILCNVEGRYMAYKQGFIAAFREGKREKRRDIMTEEGPYRMRKMNYDDLEMRPLMICSESWLDWRFVARVTVLEKEWRKKEIVQEFHEWMRENMPA